jgi:hypothetical protein
MIDSSPSLGVALDILGRKPTLRINGRTSTQTKVGVGLTVVAVAVIILMSADELYQLTRRDQPRVVREERPSDYGRKLDLIEGNQIPILFLFSGSNPVDAKEVSRFATVRLTKVRYSMEEVGEGENMKRLVREERESMMGVTCRELMAQSSSARVFVDDTANFDTAIEVQGVCMNATEGVRVEGKRSEREYTTVEYRVYPCSLAEGCASAEEMESVRVQYNVARPVVNLPSTQHTVEYIFGGEEQYFVDTFATQRRTSMMQEVQIVDERGWSRSSGGQMNFIQVWSTVGSSQRRGTDLKVQCTKQEIEAEETNGTGCRPYLVFEMVGGGPSVVIRRLYTSAIETAAHIGGIGMIVWLVLSWVYGRYNEAVRRDILVGKVYGIYDPTFCSPMRCMRKRRDKNCLSQGLVAAPKKVVEEAHRLLDESLDEVSIVREINVLRFLTTMLLKQEHRVVIPIVSLNLGLEKKKRRRTVNERLRAFRLLEKTETTRRELKKKGLSVEEAMSRISKASKGGSGSGVNILQDQNATDKQESKIQVGSLNDLTLKEEGAKEESSGPIEQSTLLDLKDRGGLLKQWHNLINDELRHALITSAYMPYDTSSIKVEKEQEPEVEQDKKADTENKGNQINASTAIQTGSNQGNSAAEAPKKGKREILKDTGSEVGLVSQKPVASSQHMSMLPYPQPHETPSFSRPPVLQTPTYSRSRLMYFKSVPKRSLHENTPSEVVNRNERNARTNFAEPMFSPHFPKKLNVAIDLPPPINSMNHLSFSESCIQP